MKKERLDVLIVDRGLVESRSKAQRLIMAGEVLVNDQLILKPSTKVNPADTLVLKEGDLFVSRGGKKLDWALGTFNMRELSGLICADVGASTGGFTDCLLQHGVKKVYAIDVGYGVLHWKIRNHPDVVVMERTNARYVESLPEKVHLVTIDASFIPLKILFPVIRNWMEKGQIIALVKPQFEAGREEAARGKGVIKDPVIHRHVLQSVLKQAEENNFSVLGLTQSPILGPKGNVEFLVHLGNNKEKGIDWGNVISEMIPDEDQS